LAGWLLYDWANTAFFTVVQTFVFAAYFTRAVAVSETAGTTQWAVAITVAGLVVAVAGPVLGAVADRAGARKAWLGGFTALGVSATALLSTVEPSPKDVLIALALVGTATVGSEAANVFYNAMLPSLVPEARIGRVSGWGWAAGYAGGVLCLVVALTGLIGVDQGRSDAADAASGVRASMLLVAAWYLLFSLPLFVFTPDPPSRGVPVTRAVLDGLGTLRATLRRTWRQGGLVRFLVAHMLYVDGLGTLFAFGGIYAASTFGLNAGGVALLGIMMTVVAGLGAAAFGWLDDAIGAKRTLVVSLVGLIAFGIPLLLVRHVTAFWVLTAALAVFVGPVQSASRSFMARAAPPELRTQLFGLHALSGKATAFLGPALLGVVTAMSGSQRAGMATIFGFLLAGLFVLWPLPTAEELRATYTGGAAVDDD
jgi:UMF1 family MFS transporter